MNDQNGPLRWNPWRELTIVAVMVMEVSWGVLWLQLVSPPLRSSPEERLFLVMLMTLGLAHLVARGGNALKLKKSLYRGLMVSLALACVWFSLRTLLRGLENTQFTDFLTQPLDEVSASGRLIPPEIWIIIATLLLIWRGLKLAQSWGGRDTVFTSLLWGIALFAVYGVMSILFWREMALWLLYVFLSAALLAMVTARVSSLVRMRGGTHSPFDLRWMGSILGAALVITGTAAVISGIVSRQVERLNEIVRLIVYGFVSLLVLPIAYLLKLGEPAVQAVRGMLPTPTPAPNIPEYEAELEVSPGVEVLADVPTTGDTFLGILQPVLIGVAILVLLILVWRIANAWVSQREEGAQDERQSLLEGISLWEMFIRALRNRLSRTVDGITGHTRLRKKDQLRAAARIRRIYADLLSLCEEMGHPRPLSLTPLEFLPAAVKIFPDNEGDLAVITGSYLRIRYGELPETHQEVDNVETAWKHVNDQRDVIKKQLQSKKQA